MLFEVHSVRISVASIDNEPVIHVAADLHRQTLWVDAQTRNHRVYDLFEEDANLFSGDAPC
jgi:hypothetical protein